MINYALFINRTAIQDFYLVCRFHISARTLATLKGFPQALKESANIIPPLDHNMSDKKYISDLLKPTGHMMHQQFNIQQFTFCPHCICVFCIYLKTNSDLCHLQHKLIGFYNRDEKCLLRGTNWVFK